ncbi:hypothetical protein B1757_02295 [Acidithiobacillus marinus]|uniref:Excisionase n=1 Tax=Acidithiobacillus marinus TaxID=187490 RepID=A0A2I1DPK8_9PROT|nr:hypothetical protein [Acidithiobacillus marinus]PKY11813.1 hypothetical protein B1757_02295 [Acidithiobacillus marinus]
MKLIKADRFRETCFEEGSAPDMRTVHSWVKDRLVPGVIINGRTYIDLDKWESMVPNDNDNEFNELIARVIGG